MKLKWDKINKRLMNGKKAVKKTDLDKFALYAIYQVENGKSINEIFPMESTNVPRLADIRYHIDENFKEEFAKASASRHAYLQEQLVKMVNDFNKNKTKDNMDAMAATEKVYSSLSKHHEQQRPFNIQFDQIFPDDFWDDVCPIEPETPRNNIELNQEKPL